MKYKLAGLASAALLLMAPISGAVSVGANPTQPNPKSWDYDTAKPGLGEYDQLLQNAGPTDGQVDWYPAEHFASSKNIRPSLLVKQLIELSIATNEANSKARNVLFNDTTGTNNSRPGYEDVYQKYNLAFGFIAQLLDFNNEKAGEGAYLKQGFESTDGNAAGSWASNNEDKIVATNRTPDERILQVPKIGEGKNISDILGTAIFGDPDQSYAQLYVNGYDNTVQNAPNIIRETTTSITLVAQSKLTGRKATAIFKLNNKTFNELPEQVLLENDIDNSPSFNGQWGNSYNPDNKDLGDSTSGTFNQTKNLVTGLTNSQKLLLSNGGSSAWVDPQTGSGTIVVPRGTSATEIAKKIKQLGYKSNYNIANVAPMKAIHGDKYDKDGRPRKDDKARTNNNSYNVTFGGVTPLSELTPANFSTTPLETTGNITALSNNKFNNVGQPQNDYFAVADPRLKPAPEDDKGYVEDGNIADYNEKALTKNFSNSLLYNPLNTNRNDEFGFKKEDSDSGSDNSENGYNNNTAATIPNQKDTAHSDNKVFDKDNRPYRYSYYKDDSINYLETQKIDAKKANDELGNVVHAFEPSENGKLEVNSKTPFAVREAWDDTHAIFGTAPFTGLTEEQIKDKIANNGSFNNTAGDQIKKSFTFNMPLNNTVMKSYRNPYSTVISTALPFSQYTSDDAFKAGVQYTGSSDNDMNKNLKDSEKAGNYISGDSVPATNPWYDNNDDAYNEDWDSNNHSFIDETGYKLDINPTYPESHKILHLNETTWSDSREDSYYKPGIHNVTSNNNNVTKFSDWIKNSTNDVLTVNEDPKSSSLAIVDEPVGYDFGEIADASNDLGFRFDEGVNVGNNFITNLDPNSGTGLWPDSKNIDDTDGTSGRGYNSKYQANESHDQLASNIGYILINAVNLSESAAKKLSKFQLPVEQDSTNDQLNGIANLSSYYNVSNNTPNERFLQSRPVNDDLNYRGGLIGTMSINNNKSMRDGTGNVIEQNLAGSIYNQALFGDNFNSKKFKVPGLGDSIVNTDVKPREGLVGSKFTGTNLHYGLTWNDSSDLPQVKIKRSLNAQYLVPVSLARRVTTTWTQYNKNGIRERVIDSSGNDSWQWVIWPAFQRQVVTKYSDYRLYLGNVKLESDKTKIDTSNDSLADLKPVNNQIEYTRIDKSYPHYDSELFDHGSNRNSITVTHNHDSGNFVGNTEEKDTNGTAIPDNRYVGSSDDYSIGIVHAPKDLFEVDANGIPEGVSGLFRKNGDVTSTENKADREQGINQYTDTPENSNGMSIGKKDSYTTLADAYNVDIVNGKAVGKADDQTKNKDDRVALVQQLLDNGGNEKAYYYIPSLPRLYEHWNEARINVVIYDQAAVPAPSKPETKPSFSTTDVSKGKDPFKVNLRPYTTVYDDGAVLKESDVPENFKNLIAKDLVAGNPDLVSDGKVATGKLQQILISSFLGSWQQNDGSFNQTDTGAGVNSPLYLYGGFGISNSDSKNSYSQWPDGYATPTSKTSKYYEAVSRYPGDFYRGGKDLKTMGKEVIKGIPASALKADVSQVDLSKAGSYPVVFTYTNPNNAKDTASITVPITVKDAAAPVFAFQGGSDVTLKVGESFDRNAFKVVGSWQIFNKYEGNYDKLVNYEGIAKNSKGEPEVTISGDVDTQTPGVYQLIYKATSIGGATTTMTRNITVLPKETNGDNWQVSEFASIGYINYVPNYGINVWNAPAGVFTGQRLAHGSAWKIFKKATNAQGKVFYNVGKNQWIDGQYVSFSPVTSLKPLKGIVTIDYVPGYGVNLWKKPNSSGGYYAGRKLKHGTQWKTFGLENGFYKVGNNQWIQGKYAKFKAN